MTGELSYPWISAEWVEDDFHTTRNRDQIEKTEDYSLGWRARAQLGFATTALGSDRDAFVLGGGVSKGLALGERQSMLLDADATGGSRMAALRGGRLQVSARVTTSASLRVACCSSVSREKWAQTSTPISRSCSAVIPGCAATRFDTRRATVAGCSLPSSASSPLVPVPALQRWRRGVLRHGLDLGSRPTGHAQPGTAAGRGLRTAPRQQPLGDRQCAAHRRGVSARRGLLDSQRAIPHRDPEELLMLGVPNHSRPMIRVETLVLIVTAWIVATANGAWWKAIGQGRDWSQPGNWLFMICCFITLVGLHFACSRRSHCRVSCARCSRCWWS